MSSNDHRSNSVAASVRSRNTLLENDQDLTPNTESMSNNTYEVVTDHPPKYTWVDRLLGRFCIKLSSKTKTPNGSENMANIPSSWPSPWIVPVHVVSNRHDADRHPITKIAKCTIDTGNMQGNIVSREFAENVLGFPSSGFRKMTKEEEMGGTGITGDTHIPQGAVYLTWYHENSTRVFRDMRFLISPTPHCDLIIGAPAILQNKILNVPCLMVPPRDDFVGVPSKKDPEELQRLKLLKHRVEDEWNEKKVKRNDIKREDEDYEGELPDLERDIPRLENEVKIVRWTIEIYDGIQKREEKQKLKDIWDAIELNYPQVSADFHKEIHASLEKIRDALGIKDKTLMPGGLESYATGAQP